LVTTGIDCGIDVECIDRIADIGGLGQHVLGPAERATLSRLPADSQREEFFRYWTLKEAYAKARGYGMSIPFDRLSFSRHRGVFQLWLDPPLAGDPDKWQFEQCQITPRHMLGIALRRGRAPNRRVFMHTTLPHFAGASLVMLPANRSEQCE
jgi:4'-phosphopantetheinyl transferase